MPGLIHRELVAQFQRGVARGVLGGQVNAVIGRPERLISAGRPEGGQGNRQQRQAGAEIGTAAPYPARLRVDIDELNIEPLASTMGLAEPLQGSLSASATAEATAAAPTLRL